MGLSNCWNHFLGDIRINVLREYIFSPSLDGRVIGQLVPITLLFFITILPLENETIAGWLSAHRLFIIKAQSRLKDI